MKVIIVGCGKIGYTIAKVLSVKKDIHVTVVDSNPNILDNAAEPIDVIFISGNGVNEKTLIEAGAKDANLILSTTNSDELNVLCCIMAERLGTKHSIARVRKPEYMLEYNKLWKDLGIDVVINPERQAAREISRILRYPAANEVETFVGGRIEMVTIKVSETPDFFVGKRVSQLFDRKMGVLLAVVERGEKALIPDGDFVFEEFDIVRMIGRPSHIMKVLTHINKNPKKAQEVMIIGGGRITHYLVELLIRHISKTNIKIVEKDRAKCEALYESLTLAGFGDRCLFVHGDGADEELLSAEELDKMDAFVCLTDRDEGNAIISLYAQQRGVRKVVTKINHMHQSMIRNLGLGLGNIIVPQNITANSVIRYVDGLTGIIGNEIKTKHQIFSGENETIDAIEFQVNQKAKCLGIPIKDLRLKKGILIGCISRESDVIIPSGDTQIQIGDSVIIIAKNNDIRDSTIF